MVIELRSPHLCASHMANLHIYVTGFLLLLTWNWRTSTALPVRTLNEETCIQCSALFRTLLLDVSGLLKSDVLWYGISSDKILITSPNETVLTCAPTSKTSSCPIQRSAYFSESECLKNIMQDLTHYEAIIRTYINLELKSPEQEVPLLRQTLQIIHNLLESCSLKTNEKASSKDTSHLWVDDSFSNRRKMLMMMRAFHIRTITFNRAMGYITSGEHRKSSGPY